MWLITGVWAVMEQKTGLKKQRDQISVWSLLTSGFKSGMPKELHFRRQDRDTQNSSACPRVVYRAILLIVEPASGQRPVHVCRENTRGQSFFSRLSSFRRRKVVFLSVFLIFWYGVCECFIKFTPLADAIWMIEKIIWDMRDRWFILKIPVNLKNQACPMHTWALRFCFGPIYLSWEI